MKLAPREEEKEEELKSVEEEFEDWRLDQVQQRLSDGSLLQPNHTGCSTTRTGTQRSKLMRITHPGC